VVAHSGLRTWTDTAQRRGHPPAAKRGRPQHRQWTSIVGLGFGRPPKREVDAHKREVAAPKREAMWTSIGMNMADHSCLMAAQSGQAWPSIVEGCGHLLAVQCGRIWTLDMDRGGQPLWTYLAVHIGRTWTSIVYGCGRRMWAYLAAQSGRTWTSIVDGCGRRMWAYLAAQSGRTWTSIVDALGHPSWTEVDAQNGRELDGHLSA